MLSRVTSKNVGDVFFETQCILDLVDNVRYFDEIIVTGGWHIF